MATNGVRLTIKGKVQGVGFRPTVWQVAQRLGVIGDVGNNAAGVEVRLWGSDATVFILELRRSCPPLAVIDSIDTAPWHWVNRPLTFSIIPSHGGAMSTQVVPDAATCVDCLAELNDPANRRWRYPFINCTHCGPRFTLIRRMPYDRPNTAMDRFPLCAACLAEYQHPADRRFHAQPNACPHCGPQVWLANAQGAVLAAKDQAIAEAARRLCAGEILAIKGLGGFHLACDATNGLAVMHLRQRKRRPSKPLAVMVPDIAWLQRWAGHDNPALTQLLQSPAAPIVLIPWPVDSRQDVWHDTAGETWTKTRSGSEACYGPHQRPLCDLIAPQLHELGVMLPANPLQHLLMRAVGRPLVMTSGNRNGRPPALDNSQALNDLATIADGWLLHDRDIVQRADDSLVRLSTSGVEMLRRSRGYVPDTLALPPGFARSPAILALGADLKNTFCLLRDGQAVLSQHLGDLADEGIQQQQQQVLALYRDIWNFTPTRVVVDAHPGYVSHRWGETLAAELGVPCISTLHHHAHLVACLAEQGWPLDAGPVIGLALDGLGYGAPCTAEEGMDDAAGNSARWWGGECLKVDYCHCEWLGGLPAVAMPGGDLASRQPWRNLLAQWLRFVPDWRDLPEAAMIVRAEGELLARAINRGINAPMASSTGRLFDAVAAALGLCEREISWEGEAACRLEALAWRAPAKAAQSTIPVTLPLLGNRLDLATFWRQWLDWRAEPADRAYAFHLALAQGFAALARQAAQRHGLTTLALSGGVMHNRLFRELLVAELPALRILQPSRLPAGDGGLALGQALIAAARYAQ
ncbi:carbamoyltransferase HypF [Acerihabitans sp. TG2]|uniref:carbamoyltransferase HypF n=1 Tax=Acerihabitans sp. TG2 TaxID=3096008 RepID=UPI002B23E9BE|nr:carbamoyltransferase HypF [Acerihabitans sp. TG2]MEA9391348.1 carbamoyltransferase HypF [Acerihabitans sp. TG2]